jgi:phosphoglycolate phosphatase
MMGKRRLMIFDLDGTLIDAYAAVVESVNVALKAVALPKRSLRVIKRSVGWGDRHLLEGFVGPRRAAKALSIYREHHRSSLKRGTKFLPGTRRVLKHLKSRGYLLAIASNRPKEFSHIILEHLRIKHYFDYVLCGDEVKRPKPYPDILMAILRNLNTPRAQAVYVGDMTIDVITGRKARVKTVAVTTGSSKKEELLALKPWRCINRLTQLMSLLEP